MTAASETTIRYAQVSERDALEQLHRRSSMHEPMYRGQLAAHPDAIELPAAGEARTRFGTAPRMSLSIAT